MILVGTGCPLVWSIVFVVLMLCMVVVELLTPSMGGFTLAALAFSGVSVYTGFLHSPPAGYVITVEDLQKAAKQELVHESISNPAVKELLKLIGQIGNATPGSDETKGRMLTELKSSFVYFGCPVIYLTINPTDRHSPLSLLYAGEEIDVNNFNPDDYNYLDRVRILLQDPLAAVDYFHNMIQTIITFDHF